MKQAMINYMQQEKNDELYTPEEAIYPILKYLDKSKIYSVKEGDRCPLCGKGIIIRGRTQLGCNRYKEGCNFRAPFPTDVDVPK